MAVSAALVPCLPFLPLLPARETFWFRDFSLYFVPMKALLVELWRAGELPLWDPYLRNGLPFLANPQTGVFYPPSLLLVAFGLDPGLQLFILLHLAAAGLGFHLFLRAAGFRPISSLFGAIGFGLGGFLASLINVLNNLQAAAWLPWILLFALRLRRSPTRGSVLGLVAAVLLALLGGELQLAALALGIASLLVVLAPEGAPASRGAGSEVPSTGRTGRRVRLRAGSLLLLCVASAGCLGAVQLLPTAELLRESVRQDGLPFALAADDSFDPSALSGFAFPRPAIPGNAETGARMSGEIPWLLSAYVGVAIAWLAALGLLGPRRRWAVFWCAIAAAGALLALGRHSPVFQLVYELVPPFRSLRYPEKFLLLAALAFPALAAAGMERVLGGGFRRRDVALGLAVVAGSALASVRLVHDAARPEAANALAMAAAVGTGVAGVLLLAHRRKLAPGGAGVLLCALAAADLAVAARAVNPSVPWSFYREPWAAEVLRRQGGDPRAFRVRSTPLAADMNQYAGVPQARIFSNHYLFHHSLAPNLGQLYGFLQQDGMAGIETLGTADLIDALLAQSDLRVQLRLLRLLGVGYLVTSFPLPAEDVAHVATHDELPIGVVRMRQPLPRAYLAREWSVAPDARRALEQALEPGFALGEAVVLDRAPGFDSGSIERPPASAGSSRSARAGRVRKAVWGDASAELELDLPGPALLVLTDSYYPGWTAEVDGASAPVLRANGYQRAVAVDAGRHAVALRYRPASLELGAWISAGTLLLLLAVGLLTGRRRGDSTSRAPRPQEPSSVTGQAGAPSAGERARGPLEPEFPSRLSSPVGS